jgi:hypothetical protein
MAAHYAIEAARLATPDDENFKKAEVLDVLRQLKGELDQMSPSELREDVGAFPRLEYVRKHVENLLAAGKTPGAPELWTLSAAVDRLAGMGDELHQKS